MSDEKYRSIFNEIVEIMHNDHAGCKDKAGWDQPDIYKEQLVDIDDNQFIDIVQGYLLDFKDLHTGFKHINKEEMNIGFTVRRFQDHLYISSSKREERLNTGDKIVALDGNGISKIAQIYEKELQTNVYERQKWESILLSFNKAEIVTKQGEKQFLELSKYKPITYVPEYSIQELKKDILYLKLTDFLDHNSISQLIRDNEDRLSTYPYLIVDVRENKGGSDLAYFDLLPYVFEGEKIDISTFSNERVLTNCTERNVGLRIQMLQDTLALIEDNETRRQIHIITEELENHRGEGFVELNLSELEKELIFETKPGPNKVIILSDVYCGSSGDSFVETCKYSSKVTVIGRPTLGMNDYANVAFKEWGNKFQLMYPTSKSSRVDEGKGMSGKGIQPDVYIPWTPLHLEHDIDLENAIQKCFKDN